MLTDRVVFYFLFDKLHKLGLVNISAFQSTRCQMSSNPSSQTRSSQPRSCCGVSESTWYRVLKLWRETGDVVNHIVVGLISTRILIHLHLVRASRIALRWWKSSLRLIISSSSMRLSEGSLFTGLGGIPT